MRDLPPVSGSPNHHRGRGYSTLKSFENNPYYYPTAAQCSVCERQSALLAIEKQPCEHLDGWLYLQWRPKLETSKFSISVQKK